ncbi:hypothetical protein CF319_g2926 [Tilletia indica]|nr:hypothetical protein CF319_g2926 [Tilletia indica]
MAASSSSSTFAPGASETDSGRTDVAMSDAAPGSSQASMGTDSTAAGGSTTTGASTFAQATAPQDTLATSSRIGAMRAIPQVGLGGPQKRRALGKVTSHRAAPSGGGFGTFGYGEQGDWGVDYEDAMARRMGEEKPLLDERIRERYIRDLGDIFDIGR